MKTLTIKTFAVLTIAFTAFTMLNSCKKEKITPSTSTTTLPAPTVNNFAFVTQGAIDGLTAFMSSNKNSFKTGSAEQAFGSCGTVTVDTTTLPYSKTWNFGTGCTGSDGHFRSGSLVITSNSNNIEQAGDTITIVYNNYVCDSMRYGGEMGVASYTDGSGFLNYQAVMAVSVTVNGTTYPEHANLNWQWIAGMGSNPEKNIQFSITGSVNGYDNNHNSQVATITSPLLKNYATPGCNYIVGGIVSLVTNGSATDSLNFGDGTSCTGTYTQTVNGKSITYKQ